MSLLCNCVIVELLYVQKIENYTKLSERSEPMIPLKLETLLEGRVVESDRVEYKRGWNPSEVITTICAYANDFSNINGGYIVVGIEEKYGAPVITTGRA